MHHERRHVEPLQILAEVRRPEGDDALLRRERRRRPGDPLREGDDVAALAGREVEEVREEVGEEADPVRLHARKHAVEHRAVSALRVVVGLEEEG